jgi:hypothetical protein
LRAIAEETELEGTETNFVSLDQTLERTLSYGSSSVEAADSCDLAADNAHAACGSDQRRQDVGQAAPDADLEPEPEPALDLVPDDTEEQVPAQQSNAADRASEADHQRESPVASPPTEPGVAASGASELGAGGERNGAISSPNTKALGATRRGATPVEQSLGEKQLSVYFDRQLCAALLDAWSVREPSSIAVQ